MTSNLGSDKIQERFEKAKNVPKETTAEKAKEDVMLVLKHTIRPEFLNRIDDIVLFTPLDRSEIREIVSMQLKGLSEMLLAKKIYLKATEEAIETLSEKGFDPQFGARPVKRVVQKEVLNALSKEILAGKIKPTQHILLDAFDGKFVFRNN
jgi:ATP-dependent Clp protease ATP-binding subunit ClpB